MYKTEYHVVWVSKYRRKILRPKGVVNYFKKIIRRLERYYPEWEIFEVGIDIDHVHIHMVIPPKYAVARVIQIMKSNTARELKQKFSFLRKVYWGTQSIWSKGYFVSTVGINSQIISNYVRMQGAEDSGQAQLEL